MMRLLFATWLTAFTAAVLGNPSAASAQATTSAPTYLDPVDLGTLGGLESRAYSEKGGRIVGASQTSDGAIHAFKYEQGAMIDLGTLGGTTSWAFAINSAGSIVGSASLGGDVAVHAFLWTETDGMMDLGTLGGTYSRAAGINDDGQIAGWAQMPGDTAYHAFLWDATNGMQDLGTLGGETSFAYDIAAGMVCGEAMLPDGSSHAFTIRSDGWHDLGTLGGTYSAAITCGEPRQAYGRPVAGESSITGDSATHAVSWDQYGVHDLGTLGGAESRALRVSIWGNNGGEIFGESQTGTGDTHPFQWWRGQLSDFSPVLGDDSRIESVMRNSPGLTVMSGAAFGRADVHAYMASIPQWRDPSPARTITAGVLEARGVLSSRLAFQADETAADLITRRQLVICHPCSARDRISLSVNQFVTSEAFGSATVRGNSYPDVTMPQVQLTVMSDSFIVPDTGERLLTFSAPFTFSGFVLGTRGYSQNWFEPDMLFGTPVTGAGTVTLELSSCEGCVHSDGRRIYDQRALKYSFEPR
jgi:probable HAF family extracellular repeat protein